MSIFIPPDIRLHATTTLDGFPPEVVESYLAYAENGDPDLLNTVVLGVLQFYLANPPAEALVAMPGSTRLVEDLGCDSLTMVDMVFLSESLFGIKLADDELAKVVTLDDLKHHFQRHVTAPSGSASS
jgi:acyl carrier protein